MGERGGGGRPVLHASPAPVPHLAPVEGAADVGASRQAGPVGGGGGGGDAVAGRGSGRHPAGDGAARQKWREETVSKRSRGCQRDLLGRMQQPYNTALA